MMLIAVTSFHAVANNRRVAAFVAGLVSPSALIGAYMLAVPIGGNPFPSTARNKWIAWGLILAALTGIGRPAIGFPF